MIICHNCLRPQANGTLFCPRDGTPLQASNVLPVGYVFEREYEIEALIAQTRSGKLYRARHVLLGNCVALKIFNPELCDRIYRWLSLFQYERQDPRWFSHPNVVKIYNLSPDYMVMEYVEGETLDVELRRRGRFTPREAVELLQPVARALDAMRAHGITYAFLTPADIMIERAGSNHLSVKLLPLIFNRLLVDRPDSVMSKMLRLDTEAVAVHYIARELWDGGLSLQEQSGANVYSLGVISYELLTGRKPYDGATSDEVRLKQAAGRPTLLSELAPGIPPPVARVVERAMANEAKNRHPTAGEFVSDLQAALGLGRGIADRSLEMPVDDDIWVSYSRGERIETKSRNATSAPAETPVADKPLYTDENVQFTVYQPEAIAPARWYMLLALAHLSKQRPDAPPDEPEPLAEVKRIAARVLADQETEYDAVKQNSLHAVPRAGEITFVPSVEGCEFNPPRQSFSWQKSVHKVEFEMRAAATLDGQMARGRLTVFLGSLILADVPLAVRVDGASGSPATVAPSVPASASPYRKIFPSYSHKDRAVVEQIEQHVHALGDKYLRDLTELRAGQDWQRWMRDAIREADVFQLFWSHNSMRSVYVRQEWEYALSLGRQNFVRPTYWELPLPESPAENLPPDELRQLHFQHLRSSISTARPTSAIAHEAQAASPMAYVPSRPPHVAKGQPLLWVKLLISLLIFVALVAGIYLLVRLL